MRHTSALLSLMSISVTGIACNEQGDTGAEAGLVETNITLMDCDISQPELEAALGVAHVYTESSDGTTRSILANGIPNHPVGDYPKTDADPPANTAEIQECEMSLTVPVSPSGGGGTLGGDALMGVATSGVVFHWGAGVYYDGDRDSGWQYDLMQSDGFGIDLAVDCNIGHVFPGAPDGSSVGQYHYHGTPWSMVPDDPALTFIGWAADGYPIFGVWGYDDPDDASSGLRELLPGYRLKEGERPDGPGGAYDGTFIADYEHLDGVGDLDACNGRAGAVSVDGETYDYAYYTTRYFPYMPPCLSASADGSFTL
jgi:hypothetical protein